jgi:hypothetical protein
MAAQGSEHVHYEGTSAYMLWAPRVFVFAAVVMYVNRWNHWIEFATAFLLMAWIHSRRLPWNFEIQDDGIRLRFPFGRRIFVVRTATSVRVDVVGAMLYDERRGHRALGYPLMDGILFRPGRQAVLRSTLSDLGYTII